MPSSYTSNLHLELQATGENSGTWGAVLNSQAFSILDQSLGQIQTLSLSSTDVTVSTSQSQSNGFRLTGALSNNVAVIFPSIGRTYFVSNETSGSYTVTLKTDTAGTTAIIPQGTNAFYVLNVTDVIAPSTSISGATISDSTIILKQSAAPTPTAEGALEWDTNDNQMKVGDGAATVTFSDDSKVAVLAATDQLITGGAQVTPLSLGTKSSGTTTLNYGSCPLQAYTNGGAHTLAPDADNGYIFLDITNNGSAGAITTSGWAKVVGAFTTTNGHKFRCSCSTSTAGSLLTIQAMQ